MPTAAACAATTGLAHRSVRRRSPRRRARVPGRPGQPDAGDVDVAGVQQPPARCGGLAFLVRHHRLRPHAARCADGLHRRARKRSEHVRPCRTSRIARPYGWGEYDTVSWNWRAAWSYVTGGAQREARVSGHADEVRLGRLHQSQPDALHVHATASPTSVNYTLSEQFDNANRAVAHSIFLQDQWTRGRMTLQGALRYDHVHELGAGRGQRHGSDDALQSDADPVPAHGQRDRAINDLTPRIGLAYDLFGNGKTALKVSAGKYLSAATADGIYSSQSPGLQLRPDARTVPWTDSNGNFAVDCNLLSSGGAEHQRDRRRCLRRADRRQPELRQPRSEHDQSRSGDPERLGRAAVQLELRRIGAARAASRRLGRRRLQPSPLGQLLRHLQRARRRRATTTCGRFRCRTIPTCRTPAAPHRSWRSRRRRRRAARAASRRRKRTSPARRAPRTGTAWTSTPPRGWPAASTLQMGTTHRPRRAGHLRAVARASAAVRAATRLDACDVTEPWLTAVPRPGVVPIPKIDVLASTTIRSTKTTASENASNGTSLNGELPDSEHRRADSCSAACRRARRRPRTRRSTCWRRASSIRSNAAPKSTSGSPRSCGSAARDSTSGSTSTTCSTRTPRHLRPDVPVLEQRGDVAGSDGHPGAAAGPVQRDATF